MDIQDVKAGQRVRILESNLFYGWNIDKIGTVTTKDESWVTVVFDDGDDDYGYAEGLELVEQAVNAPAASIKAAIADVERALATLKALVG